MPIEQAVCLSYKEELFRGVHKNDHLYKIALFTENAVLNKYTKSYLECSGEVQGTGYEKGGKFLIEYKTDIVDDYAILTFTKDLVWENSSFSTYGALIYNYSLESKNSIAVLSFEENLMVNNENFLINFSAFNRKDALIKII